MAARALLALLLALIATAAAAQGFKLAPVDEGASDPQWPRFKARLLEALGRRDQQFLLSIVDRNIRNTTETAGAAEFRKLWDPQSSSSPLWSELPKVLFLGSVYVKRDARSQELCAPYVYYRWPRDGAGDASGAIVARETVLRTQPAESSASIAALSYDLVAVSDWEVDDLDKQSAQKWVKVKAGSREGFVPEEHVRSPLEYRACFANSGGRWRMTAFEVGE